MKIHYDSQRRDDETGRGLPAGYELGRSRRPDVGERLRSFAGRRCDWRTWGIVTDRDICIALGTRNVRPSDLRVRDVIKDHILACKLSDDSHMALQAMRDDVVTTLQAIYARDGQFRVGSAAA